MPQNDTEMLPPPPPFHIPPSALPPIPPPPPPATLPQIPHPPTTATVTPPTANPLRQFQESVEDTIQQTFVQTPQQQQQVDNELAELHRVIDLHVAQLRQSIGHLVETPIKMLLEKNTLLRAGNVAHHQLLQFHQNLMDAAVSKRDDAICELRIKLGKTQDDLVLVSGDLCARDAELDELKKSIVRLGDALRTCEDQLENAYARLERRESQLQNTSDAMRLGDIKLDDALRALGSCDSTIAELRGELQQKCEENAALKKRLAGSALLDMSRGDHVPAKRQCLDADDTWFTVDGQTGSLGRHVDANDLVRVLVLSPFDCPVPLTLEEAEDYVSNNSFVYGVPLECGIVFQFFYKDPSETYSRVPDAAAWSRMFSKYPELDRIKDHVRIHVCNSNVNTLTAPSMKDGEIKFKARKGSYENMACAVAEFDGRA